MTPTLWIVAIIIIAIVVVLYIRSSLKRSFEGERLSNKRQVQDLRKASLMGLLERIVNQMDATANFYTNEDEASRELTSCLNILGHKAVYHYQLGDKRTADIFVDNCIIESKLDPNQSDVDRLVGQVGDYANTFPYYIYIVIFGNASIDIIDRINKQVISTHDFIQLVYLDRPNRIRQ